MEHELITIKNCPICNSDKTQKFLTALDHNVSNDPFTIEQCLNCAFKFTNPKPSASTIGDYYKSANYVSHSGTKKGLINKVYHTIRKRAIKQKCRLAKKHSSGKSLLDIGCGTGEFLNYCKTQNWITTGLEPDENARQFAKNTYSLNVQPIESLYKLEEKSFDTITLWHVLEHVYELQNDLNKISQLLKPDGTLIIAVPNCSSHDAHHYKEHWAAYDLPIHLYHFTPNDIKNLALKHKLGIIEILPMYFDSYYVSMLSEKYKGGNIIKGFIRGLVSNLKASTKKGQYSSQIYVLKHLNAK